MKGTGSWVGVQIPPLASIAVGPWTSDFTVLGPSFLISKMGCCEGSVTRHHNDITGLAASITLIFVVFIMVKSWREGSWYQRLQAQDLSIELSPPPTFQDIPTLGCGCVGTCTRTCVFFPQGSLCRYLCHQLCGGLPIRHYSGQSEHPAGWEWPTVKENPFGKAQTQTPPTSHPGGLLGPDYLSCCSQVDANDSWGGGAGPILGFGKPPPRLL